MRAALPCLLLLAGAGCADVLGIEPWDASLGVGGGSTSSSVSGQGPVGSGGEAASSTGPSSSGSAGDGGAGAGSSASSGPGGGDGGQGGAGCGVGEARCGDACVDTRVDPAHCGACDHGCFGGGCDDARCGSVALGALDGPLVLAASSAAVWVLDNPAAGPAEIERVELSGSSAEVPTPALRFTLPMAFVGTSGVGAADSLGFFFAGYEDDTELVLRFLDGATTLVHLGEATFPFSMNLTAMAPSDGHLWLAGRLVDSTNAPAFVQAGVLSLSLSEPGDRPVPRCARSGNGAPSSSDVAAVEKGVAHGRLVYGGGPDIASCGVGGELLVSVTPMVPIPREVIADASHVYFSTTDKIYRVARAGAPSTPEVWVDAGVPTYLTDAGASVLWREGNVVKHRRKSAAPAEAAEVLVGASASHLTAAGDVIAWIQFGTNALMLQRLPPGG